MDTVLESYTTADDRRHTLNLDAIFRPQATTDEAWLHDQHVAQLGA